MDEQCRYDLFHLIIEHCPYLLSLFFTTFFCLHHADGVLKEAT